MTDANVGRLTGVAGVLIGVGATLVVPLYFASSGAPPPWTVLTRGLINIVTAAMMIVFITGFSYQIRRADASCDWAASLISAAGTAYVVVSLAAASLEVGAVFDAQPVSIDPTIDGPLAKGSILLHGSITRILTAVALFAAGHGELATRAFPGWIGRAAQAIAIFNLWFVPSLFWGTDPARFYSAIGWGNAAFAAICFPYWTTAVGIVILRQTSRARSRPEQSSQAIGWRT
jgi:hypothetical protein